MSKLGFFTRFTLVYFFIKTTLVMTAQLDIERVGGLNLPILIGISFWVFYTYTMKNNRLIKGTDKWELVFYALGGDMLVNIILSTIMIMQYDASIKFVLAGMLMAIPLHIILLLLSNFLLNKQIVKQYPELISSK